MGSNEIFLFEESFATAECSIFDKPKILVPENLSQKQLYSVKKKKHVSHTFYSYPKIKHSFTSIKYIEVLKLKTLA